MLATKQLLIEAGIDVYTSQCINLYKQMMQSFCTVTLHPDNAYSMMAHVPAMTTLRNYLQYAVRTIQPQQHNASFVLLQLQMHCKLSINALTAVQLPGSAMLAAAWPEKPLGSGPSRAAFTSLLQCNQFDPGSSVL